ncbi:unnamed protein product [Caretta caretta]
MVCARVCACVSAQPWCVPVPGGAGRLCGCELRAVLQGRSGAGAVLPWARWLVEALPLQPGPLPPVLAAAASCVCRGMQLPPIVPGKLEGWEPAQGSTALQGAAGEIMGSGEAQLPGRDWVGLGTAIALRDCNALLWGRSRVIHSTTKNSLDHPGPT